MPVHTLKNLLKGHSFKKKKAIPIKKDNMCFTNFRMLIFNGL